MIALPEVEHLRLLGSASGINQLLDSGKELGLKIKANTWSNLVDFGVFSSESLLSNVPLGYEDTQPKEDEGEEMYLFQSITLSLNPSSKCGVDSFSLNSYQSLPNKEEDTFRLQVVTEEGDDATNVTLTAGDELHLHIRLLIHPQYTQGHINEFLLFSFSGQTRHSSVCMSYAECTVGLRVQGTLMSPNEVILSQQLSAEAAPFTPQIALTYFDYACPIFNLYYKSKKGANHLSRNLYSVPRGFSEASLPFVEIAEHLRNAYTTMSPSEQVKTYINNQPFTKYFDTSSRAAHLKYIYNQDILNQMETLQMQKDIRFYDMRYTRMKFTLQSTPTDPKGENTLLCKLLVKGSSENRPKLSAGDIICFRPALEDLPANNLRLFELRGVVIDVKLQNEMVTCLCEKPKYDEITDQRHFNLQMVSPSAVQKLLETPRYHIRFTFDMCGGRIIQKALMNISSSKLLQLTVFPPKDFSLPNPRPRLLLNCEKIAMDRDLNLEQREAVETVSALYLRGQDEYYDPQWRGRDDFAPAPPYIIFGPPGTGKTKTLISVIRGVLAVGKARGGQPRVLACAPSDAAADVLCTRLAEFFDEKEMFRMNWWQRSLASVPLHLLKYCNRRENCGFDIPLKELVKFNIIVCTSVVAGILDPSPNTQVNQGLQGNFSSPLTMQFDLVVLDEVSQATEGESLVPVSLVKPTGVVVLSGDPEQLGPVPRSPVFRAADMHHSLQERLLQHEIYDNIRPYFGEEQDLVNKTQTEANCKFGVYLRHNYRSQKSIFQTSSNLFYHDSLLESGVVSELDSLGAWEELAGASMAMTSQTTAGNVGTAGTAGDTGDSGGLVMETDTKGVGARRPFLVLFRSLTSGTHQHDYDSPSFYNISEIASVVELCASLIKSSTVQVTPQDIGVIGAFRAQVLKLRLALRAANLGGINTGGIEDFQGQESKVIIISTVLTSRVKQLEINERLGLCGDHRKFNVAVTRGKSLCIVVGNPTYLHGDPYWRQLMNHCDTHGTFTGDPCALLDSVQREEQEEEEMLQAAARVALLDMGSNSYSNSSGNSYGYGTGQSLRQGQGLQRAYVNPYYGSELEWRGLL